MLLIQLNPNSKEPLFMQVFDQLKNLIESNVLKPGERLPSSRKFSEQLGVNRTTITRAYEELWAMGYIESRQGSYSTIRKRAELAMALEPKKQSLINWEECYTKGGHKLFSLMENQITPRATGINFQPLSPDPQLMPVQEFKQCLNHVLHSDGAALLQYGDAMGYLPLREFIAQRMQQHSICVTADEILLTNGIQNAIELVLGLLVDPGQKIAVEAPTYSSSLPLFRYHQASICEIPMTEDGMDLKALERCLKTDRPALVYTIPNFHNPTGITTSQEHREKLLTLCEKYKVPLVEDGFEEEMKYFGKVVLPIKSMDRNGIVIYMGTFSKVLFPGLRIGWITADKELIQRLETIRKTSDISGNTLNQAALHQFCCAGYYELHIRRLHRIYRKRMEIALRCIRTHLPSEIIRYTRPTGGYTLWFEVMNVPQSKEEIIQSILQQGVAISPGNRFFPSPTDRKCFRISIAHCNEEEIEKGIQGIAIALKSLIQ